MPPRLTKAVATELGVSPVFLANLIRVDRLRAPQKDASGRYYWTPADVKAAREAMSVDRRRKEHRQQKAVRHG